jgi:hypothetical protein
MMNDLESRLDEDVKINPLAVMTRIGRKAVKKGVDLNCKLGSNVIKGGYYLGTGLLKTVAAYLPNEVYSKIVKKNQDIYFKLNVLADTVICPGAAFYFIYNDMTERSISLGALAGIITFIFNGHLNIKRYEMAYDPDYKQAGILTTVIPFYGSKFIHTGIKMAGDKIRSIAIKEYSNAEIEVKEEKIGRIVYKKNVERVGGALALTEGLEGGELSETDERVGALSVRGVDYE